MSELAKLIDFICRTPFFAPRYNIAPRQQAPVIVLENGAPTLKLMRWGLIPGWAKDETIGDKLISDPRPVFTHGGSGWPLVSGANGRISSPTR